VPEKNKKYWEFKNKSEDEAELYLYIEIASWGGGNYAHSAQSFKSELDALGDIKTLNVYINSPGGDVFEGIAIYNMLKRKAKSCDLNICIDGIAASIASVIATAGNVKMPKNAMMMVHNAWSYTYGNAKDLRETANALEKVDNSIRQSYLSKAGDKLDEKTIIELMDNETWLTAQECFDYGLCNEILEEKQIAAKFDTSLLKNYKYAPDIFGVGNLKNDKKEEEVNDKEIKNDLNAEKTKLLMELDLI